MDTDSPLSPDAQYVVNVLFSDLEASFRKWSKEYQQPRDLGAVGEFVGLYRKARKLKTVFINGVDPANWRESVRTIAMEVAAHALLLVKDLDDEATGKTIFIECSSAARPISSDGDRIKETDTGKYRIFQHGQWLLTCGPECSERHTYQKSCAYYAHDGGF